MRSIKTYNDFVALGQNEEARRRFILEALENHRSSQSYRLAADAEEYAHRRNVTILRYKKLLYTARGEAVPDNWSANYKLTSNYFNRFVTQQNQYLLGNGVTLQNVHSKARLGADFDRKLQQAGRDALVQGVAFGFWNLDHLEVFRLTEFAPLYDEEDGALKAGIRFWQVSDDKPLRATLYELDGYTEYLKTLRGEMQLLRPKRAYKQQICQSPADGFEILDEENYPSFPIVPLWGSPLRQSELVGMRSCIDAYDLIKSGFANDLDDASMIYWVLENSGGMDDVDLAEFVERMKTVKAAALDSSSGAKAEAHTLEVPYQGREAALERLRRDMYDDFCALDVTQLQGGQKTATEINAAYQPLDNKCDEYEYCLLDFLQRLFVLAGVQDTPTFIRSRITNQLETTQMVLMAAQYLDDEAVLQHLPWLTPEECEALLRRRDADAMQRFGSVQVPEVNKDAQN